MSTVVGMAVVSTVLTACGSSGSKVSVDKLQQTADRQIASPRAPCPLGFDIDAALKKAGVGVTATAGAGAESDGLAVDATSATDAGPDSPLKKSGGAWITCTYTLSGGGELYAGVAGVRTGKAVNLMAPRLQHDGHVSISNLTAFITQKMDTGKGFLTPAGGEAAVAKLDASGGDVLLEVTTVASDNDEDHGPVVGEPLRKLAEELGKQVKV